MIAECPRCYEGFFWFRDYEDAVPARPRRFFGLIAARPASPARWRYQCCECGKVWRVAFEGGE